MLVAGAPAASIRPDPTLTDTMPYEVVDTDQTKIIEEPIRSKSPDLPAVERRLRFKQSGKPSKDPIETQPPSGEIGQGRGTKHPEPIFSSSDEEAGAADRFLVENKFPKFTVCWLQIQEHYSTIRVNLSRYLWFVRLSLLKSNSR